MNGVSAWWALYPLMGLVAGFFAGLLGIGGGLILVSLMVFAFNAQDFPADRVMHLALGTSLATIVFTSIKSILAHHRHGAVRWDIVRHSAAGLVLGTLAGSAIADALRSRVLAVVFTAFVVYSAVNMMLDIRPRADRRLPGPAGLQVGAGLVGLAEQVKLKEAQVALLLSDNETTEQVAAATGSVRVTDLGIGGLVLGRLGGAAGAGWSNTNEGKVVAAAFLDAHNQLVVQARALQAKALPPAVPTRRASGGS